MKFLLSLFLGLATALAAQSGKVFETLSCDSAILGGPRHFSVYLPPDYETSERSYPVLYLLHGGGDDHTAWVRFGEIGRITEAAIRDGLATPMIIIMPDANADRRGYTNSAAGDWRYEDFFFAELMPHVEKRFRIRGKKRQRAIAGNSMGGHGSFLYALHRPDLFYSACPLSAGTGPMALADVADRTKLSHSNPDTPAQQQAYFERNSVTHLVSTLSVDELTAVKWYIDCGDSDFLYEGNSLVHIVLRQREVPHEFRIRDGGHGWTYWRESLPEVLRFVTQGFHK